jgi:hypothetical protein
MNVPFEVWVSGGTLALVFAAGVRLQKLHESIGKNRFDIKNAFEMIRTEKKRADRRHKWVVVAYLRTTPQSEKRDREIEKLLLEE